ncbi:uncharacterized protein LOC9652196 isoform X2 [Selaginella moellendorffii]|nr:uncharacterized protein LOC9652196 isoform X2 [Selaginella moellendorffii]|eukprot:XP_002965739.2 uncharacterized protein LOC9652196 isoform X2 [Selaginella moellendorffii]
MKERKERTEVCLLSFQTFVLTTAGALGYHLAGLERMAIPAWASVSPGFVLERMAIPAWASVSPGFVLERMAIPAWASVSPEEQQHHRRLTLLLRSKQRVLKAPLAAMDEQERQLQSRLEGLQRMPPPQHRLLQKIVRTAIVAEVARASPAEKPEGVRQRSHDYVKMAVEPPILHKDWIIHPIQIIDTRDPVLLLLGPSTQFFPKEHVFPQAL